jgi:hypothetical protein
VLYGIITFVIAVTKVFYTYVNVNCRKLRKETKCNGKTNNPCWAIELQYLYLVFGDSLNCRGIEVSGKRIYWKSPAHFLAVASFDLQGPPPSNQLDIYTEKKHWRGVGWGLDHTARIPSPLPLCVAKTGSNDLNEKFTPLLPTGIGERF